MMLLLSLLTLLAALAIFLLTLGSTACIRDGNLSFYLFGIPTRRIALADETTFELERIGAMKFLVIHQGATKQLAPTRVGVDELAAFLRENEIPERSR
jgi:hypothetical protein